jgi:hypothetical protein
MDTHRTGRGGGSGGRPGATLRQLKRSDDALLAFRGLA